MNHPMPTKAYRRYDGFYQHTPLTPDEEDLDNVCRGIDYAQAQILAKSLALFTAHEFIWFSNFVNKTFFFPKKAQLDRMLLDLGRLLKDIEARESGNQKSTD